MLHVIEIRNKAVTLSLVHNLGNFFTDNKDVGELLPTEYVMAQLQNNDVNVAINQILRTTWNTSNQPLCTQYNFVVADKQVYVVLMTDNVGARFVLCSVRSVTNIEDLRYVYVGYDALLTSVNNMFTATHIKSDDWRYSVSKPTTMVGE